MTQSPVRTAGTLQGLALVLPCTTVVMGSAILAPNIPQMMAQFSHIPDVEFWVPVLVTLPALCIALFSTVAGVIVDRVGRRRIMMWAMALYGVFGMLPLVIQDFWMLLGSRFIVGMMEAVILCSSTTLIGDFFDGKRRDHWLAMQTTTASTSAIIMFPLGGFVGQFGWQYPFAMYGLSLLLLIPLIFGTWEPEASARLERRGTPWLGMGAVAAIAIAITYGVWTQAGWLTPIAMYGVTLIAMLAVGFGARMVPPAMKQSPAGWLNFPWFKSAGICLVTAIGAIMFYLLQILLARVLAETGVHEVFRMGIIIAIVSLGIPIGTVIFSRVSRTPVAILILVEFAIIAIGFWGMAKAPDLPSLMIASFINQLGCGLMLPTMLTWAMRQFSFEQRGRGTGVFQSFMNGGQFVGPAFVTWLAAQLTMGAIKPSFEYIAYAAVIVAAAAGLALVASKQARLPARTD